MAGDKETGVMVMKMEEGLDTGPVAHGRAHRDHARHDRRRIARQALRDRRGPDGARARGARRATRCSFTPQAKEGVTYAHKIEKSRGADRLVARCAKPARSCARPLAVSRRVFRSRSRQGPRAREGPAHATCEGRGAPQAHCLTMRSRSPAGRAPCNWSMCSAPARRR